MYGPGPIPRPPQGERPAARALWMLWRIVLMALPVVSVGLLAWVPFVWILTTRRRVRDALLLALCLVGEAAAFVLLDASVTDTDWQGNAGTALVLVMMAVTPVHLLLCDLQVTRFRRERRAAEAAARKAAYALPPAFGFPPPAPYPAAAPAPAPAPVPPLAEEKIAQVRAELDDLSRLLREQGPTG